MITKKCRGYNGHHACAEDYPDHILPIENFTKYHHRSVDIAGRCKVCVHYQNQIVGLNKQFNPRTNAISAIAYGYVGSSSKFYKLPKEERSYYRKMATMEWSNTIHIGLHSVKDKRKQMDLHEVDRPSRKRLPHTEVDDPRGSVYIFKDHMKSEPNLYKVGASWKPKLRLREANVWGDFEALFQSSQVADRASLEKEVHQHLSYYRVKGEWFQCELSLITKLIQELVEFRLEREHAREEQAMAEQNAYLS